MALPKIKKGKISLLKKIDTYLKKAANPKYSPGYKPDPRVKPSDLGSPCMRKIFYSYLRIERDFPIKPKEKRIFDTGDAFHEMTLEWCEGTGCLVKYRDPKTGEIPISRWTGKPDPEFPIAVPEIEIKKGKIDAVLIINGELWLGEFKSSKESKYDDLKGKPQDEHRIQANTYVHLFEHCRSQGMYDHIEELQDAGEVKGVIFLYINKNNSEVKEFVVPKEDGDLHEIVEKYAELKGYVDRKELPPPTEHYCFFCPWNKKCKKNYNPLDEDSE